MEGIDDEMLLDIADDIGEGEKIQRLAVKLGFDTGAASRYERMNTIGDNVTTKGTRKLLIQWRENTRMADQQRILKRALDESGYKETAEKYFGHLNKGIRLEEKSEPQNPVAPDVGGYYKSKVAPARYDRARYPLESTYNTWQSAKKGFVYILNNNKFQSCPSMKERCGSEIDVANMQHVFSELGYTPKVHKDLSTDGILESLDKIVSDINAEPDKHHGSLCLVLMSHGNEKGILGTDTSKNDERIVTIDQIKKKLSGRNCKALRGKPKLLFIQACRGTDYIPSASDSHPDISGQGTSSDVKINHASIDLTDQLISMPSVDVDAEGDQRLPYNSDIFVANATSSGFFSIRSSVEGSWFIQALSEVFLQHANVDDIHELMRKVTRKVENFRTSTKKLRLKVTPPEEVRQTPAYEMQGWRKQFYFFPKYPSSE